MNKRIERIASYIDNNDSVIDVGCDQALLSILLAKRGIPSIASDVRENIILNAKKKAQKLKLDNLVKFVVSDGLDSINENVDTLVLSGMGTHTILKILERSKYKFKKIITISNNNHDILRINMKDLGYKVLLEEIIYEKGKYYNLILFTRGNKVYTKEDTIIGVNHQNFSLLSKKIKEEIGKLKNIYEISKNEIVLSKIKFLNDYYEKIK